MFSRPTMFKAILWITLLGLKSLKNFSMKTQKLSRRFTSNFQTIFVANIICFIVRLLKTDLGLGSYLTLFLLT